MKEVVHMAPRETRTPSLLARLRARVRRDDRGMTMVEMLIVTVMVGIAAGLIAKGVHEMTRHAEQMAESREAHSQVRAVNGRLLRDVTDALTLRVADSNRLVLTVVRDDVCNVLDYAVDATGVMTRTTTFYEHEECNGASEEKQETVLPWGTNPAPFSFFNERDFRTSTPVQFTRMIKRIGWSLQTTSPVYKIVKGYPSAAAFTGVGEAAGTGTEMIQAGQPILSLDKTEFVEGVGHPVLEWTDPTPTVTASWAIFRQLTVEGGSSSPWTQLTWIGTPTTLTWTDATVPLGSRATYAVQAILTDDSVGPTSNAVVTGRRPAGTTVTVTGQPTSLQVTWPAVTGATAYDLYRDGDLLATLGDVLTYTDATGYGHSHAYRVVPVNRWEAKHTTGTEDGRLDPADATHVATKAYTGGVVRLVSPAMGGFTAPAAPTITATPSTTWTTVVARTYAGWTGAGPTTLAGVSRDRGWVVERASLSGGFAALWGEATAASQTHTGRTPGATDRYRAQTCNASGCSPWGSASALQRPPAPASCTTSGATTRSMGVTVNAAAMESSVTGYRVEVGDPDSTGRGEQASNVFTIDLLSHSSGYTFEAQTKNASPAGGGWSDVRTCAGTTAVLGVSITGASSSTRSITASMSTTNGSSSNLTLEGVRTDWNVTSATWDPLPDGTSYLLTARNSDGYNETATQVIVATQVLAIGAPSCSVSGGGAAPASMSISAWGPAGASWHEYSPAQSQSNLGEGTHSGSARAVITDGFNTSRSGWTGCGSVTVTFTPSGWGSSAPGCPVPSGWYVTPESSWNWEVRRATSTSCGLRTYVTAQGEINTGTPAGTVTRTYSYTLGSGAGAFTQLTGPAMTAGVFWP